MLFLRRNQSGCIYDIYFHVVLFRLRFGFTLNWNKRQLLSVFMDGRGYNYKFECFYFLKSSNGPSFGLYLFNKRCKPISMSEAGGKPAIIYLRFTKSLGIDIKLPKNKMNPGYNRPYIKLIYPKYKVVRIN